MRCEGIYRGRREQGLGLPTAIFVITVMAFLAVAISMLMQDNAEGSAEEFQLVRAFYSAESGIEIGLNDVISPVGLPPSCTTANSPYTFPLMSFEVDGMGACTASVECRAVEVESETYYTLTSTGQCGEVSRKIQVRAR